MSDIVGRRGLPAAVLSLCLMVCGGCEQEPAIREQPSITVVAAGARASQDPALGHFASVPESAAATQNSVATTAVPNEDSPLIQAAETEARDADLYRTAQVDPAEIEAAIRNSG